MQQLWVPDPCVHLHHEAILLHLPRSGPHHLPPTLSHGECGCCSLSFLVVVTVRQKNQTKTKHILFARYSKAVWEKCSAPVQHCSLMALMAIEAFLLLLVASWPQAWFSLSTSERSQAEEIYSRAHSKNN